MIDKEELKGFLDWLIKEGEFDYDSFGAGIKMIYYTYKIFTNLEIYNSNIVKENFHEDHTIIRKCKDITDDYFMYHMQYKDDGDICCYYKKKEVDECKDCQEVLDNYGCMNCKKEVDKK